MIRRNGSECYIVLPQGEGHTPVILGEPGDDEGLLGVVTLQPMRMLLASFRAGDEWEGRRIWTSF